MNRCLLLLLFISASPVLFAQDTFDYHRKGKYVQLIGNKTSIGFDAYEQNVNGTKERPVQLNSAAYRLVIKNDESGKIKTIVNSKDSVLATVFLNGDNRNAILLPDGRMLTRKKLAADTWLYQKDGQDVFTYTTHKEGKKKNVVLYSRDGTIPMDVLQIICLEHSAEILYSNPTAAMIGVAVGLALLRVAIASGG